MRRGAAPPARTRGRSAPWRATRGDTFAAATSTGGMQLKLPGRVGDTAIIGCGTYADDALAAVSCTGHGERIIQLTLARHVADLVGRGAAPRMPPGGRRRSATACRGRGGRHRPRTARRGRVAHNTPVMARAWTTAEGRSSPDCEGAAPPLGERRYFGVPPGRRAASMNGFTSSMGSGNMMASSSRRRSRRASGGSGAAARRASGR